MKYIILLFCLLFSINAYGFFSGIIVRSLSQVFKNSGKSVGRNISRHVTFRKPNYKIKNLSNYGMPIHFQSIKQIKPIDLVDHMEEEMGKFVLNEAIRPSYISPLSYREDQKRNDTYRERGNKNKPYWNRRDKKFNKPKEKIENYLANRSSSKLVKIASLYKKPKLEKQPIFINKDKTEMRNTIFDW